MPLSSAVRAGLLALLVLSCANRAASEQAPTALAEATAVAGPTATTDPTIAQAAPAAAPSTLELLRAAPRPLRDPTALAARVRGAIPISPPAVEPLTVGRTDAFFVLDTTTNTYSRREAELHLISPRAYWYVELGQAVGREELERSAAVFEQDTYPTVHRLFGSEASPGIDGDPRITVFLGTVVGVGAYFSSWDEYPRSVFPYSNEREIVHVNVGSIRPGSTGFDGTLAHEFQHMVQWNANPAQETWVDEGTAELASALAVPGRGIGTTQFGRRPDLQLTAWDARDTTPHYQASYLFMRYVTERYGRTDGLRGLLTQTGRPPETFDRYLAEGGHTARFDDLFQDWVVANLLDDPSVEDGRYAHAGSDPRATVLGRADLGGPPVEEAVRQYGADYVEFSGDGSGAEIDFEGAPTVRLVGADPTSGRSLWWSDRGDNMDTTMTRRFNFRDVPAGQPLTLRFNLWHETERDYDFLYVMASGDGGASWQVLRGALASDANPTGNAVGPGYSGASGSGSGGPSWIAETVDLSLLVGADVLLRFEYVTDQSYNARGALLDDVTIPEVGYADDAESDSGWVYDGFIRSDNTIPQTWGLRLVEYRRGGGIAVRPLTPGPDGRLTERLPTLGADLERAVLTVSGLAPRTLEPAPYRLALRRAP